MLRYNVVFLYYENQAGLTTGSILSVESNQNVESKMKNVASKIEKMWSPNSIWSIDSEENHYRQDAANRQTAGIVFTHRPKIRFFAPQGRLVAPIRVKLCRTDGHLGPLGCAKFHIYRCRGVGMWPQNIKNFHFLVKSRPAGATPLTDFEIF